MPSLRLILQIMSPEPIADSPLEGNGFELPVLSRIVDRKAFRTPRDSPLEGTGFEPSVPREAPGIPRGCRFSFAPDFSAFGEPSIK
jgi:hypothetical protein